MSILRSIVRNLRFILSRDLGGDLEAMLNRLETRSDRYEQAIDERLELRLGAIEASLRAEMESAKALSTELIAALSERIREQQAAMLEQLERVERRADDRLDSRLLEVQTAFDERATGYEQAVDRRIDERFNSIRTALDDRSAGYEQAVDRRIDERLNSIETGLDRRTADYEQAVDRRFDERLEALENTVSRRFIEYSRAADIRLDDRQAGLERRLDDFLRKLEERVDARHEAHELRIDQTLVSNRDDIIERTDLLLQVLDRRLDRLRTIPTTSSPRVDQSTEDSTPQAVPISREIYDWSENAASGMEIWSSDEQEVADYILSFIDNPAGREYVLQHMRRYLRTLHRIPPARRSGEQVLELGSLTPLAPAIRRYCGYQSICGSNYWPGEGKVAEKVFAQTGGGERLVIPLHNFNVETDRFPFPDGSFQVVLCGELLEHLQRDPLHMLWECNRVLAEDGQLILTTPNIAGCRSIEGVLTGCSPYLFSQYNLASSFDQHHREYAPREVRTALTAAGFEVLKLETEDVWRRSNPAILRLLESLGLPTELRGDNIFATARKAGPPVERYPSELYVE